MSGSGPVSLPTSGLTDRSSGRCLPAPLLRLKLPCPSSDISPLAVQEKFPLSVISHKGDPLYSIPTLSLSGTRERAFSKLIEAKAILGF